MDHRTRFFDKLYDAMAERVRDANGEGFEISRYGSRGLYFFVKRKQPAREVAANFMGGGSFVHLGPGATPVDVVDELVAIRITDSATMTVDQWADSMMEFLLKPEAAPAAAPKAAAKPAAKTKKVGKK